jgi:hypothetical protein
MPKHHVVPPDDTLVKLADRARVPEEQRDFYYERILENVHNICEHKKLIDGGLTKEHGSRLHQATVVLRETLDNLDENEKKLVCSVLNDKGAFVFDRFSHEGIDGLRQTVFQLDVLFRLLTGKPRPHQGSLPRKCGNRPGGRRPGSSKGSLLENFVSELLISTITAGGKLSFEKNTCGGTLPDAIEMLRPYLPEGVVPNVLPSPTLQKIKADVKKTYVEYAEWEAKLELDEKLTR